MIALLGLWLAQVSQDEPLFNVTQREAIHDALFIANLTEPDLKTDAALVPASPFVASLHEKPIHTIAALGSKTQAASQITNPIARVRRELHSEEL